MPKAWKTCQFCGELFTPVKRTDRGHKECWLTEDHRRHENHRRWVNGPEREKFFTKIKKLHKELRVIRYDLFGPKGHIRSIGGFKVVRFHK